MEELLSYRLSDLLLFTPDTYFRLYSLHNREWWPALPACLILFAGLFRFHSRNPVNAEKLALMLVAVIWVTLGWGFFLERYAQIFSVANWAGWGFIGQSGLLVYAALTWTGRDPVGNSRPAAALLIFALFVHPLLVLTMDRPAASIELFVLASDPTAVATIALLWAFPGRHNWLLIPVPMLWCLLSLLTHLAMDNTQGLLTPALGLLSGLWYLGLATRLMRRGR